MKDLQGKTCWLIGASEGLGRAIAQQMHNQGVNLILSARNGKRLQALCDALPGATAMVMDATEPDAVKNVAAKASHADIVIYNAGAYDPIATQAWDTDGILQMSAVNYTGAVHVIGAIIPEFLRRDAGEIVLIGSLAAYRGLPAALGYGSSKAALRSMAETMRYDLRETNVAVKLVNPGFIRTRLTAKNAFKMPMLMTPEKAASRVITAIRKRRFRTDFPAPFSWFIRALAILPDFVVWRGK